MSRFSRFAFAIVCVFLVHLPSFPLSAQAQPNGCGSGWNVHLVPDRIPVLNCEFGNSCSMHDACYSVCEGSTEGECAYLRCRKDGDLFNSSQCYTDLRLLQLAGAAQTRRSTCDTTFYGRMRLANKGRFACEALAVVYLKAVKVWGDSAFSGLGNVLTPPTAWKQPQDEYNKAIASFFENGTEEEFRRFVEAHDKSTPIVNLCGQLKYSPGQGLVNMSPEDANACRSR